MTLETINFGRDVVRNSPVKKNMSAQEKTMKFISLFAGIGGFDLGLERAGMECVGQVEYNPFCQRVLKHHWPHVKLIGDIHNVTEDSFPAVGLICGGFPCQPFSVAGKQRGKEDDRHLWPEMLRVIKAYRPSWVLGENVAGIINMELDNVLSDLESEGYETQALIIPACAVDARHERKRVWILAYSTNTRVKSVCGWENKILVSDPNSSGFEEQRRAGPIQPEHCSAKCSSKDVADPGLLRSSERKKQAAGFVKCSEGVALWEPESGLGRVAYGIPGRVERLRSLGNAVVPQIVEEIGRAIMKSQKQDARSGQEETGEHLTTGPLQN